MFSTKKHFDATRMAYDKQNLQHILGIFDELCRTGWQRNNAVRSTIFCRFFSLIKSDNKTEREFKQLYDLVKIRFKK